MNWSITKTFIDIKPGTAPVRINASMYDNNSRLVVMTVKDGGRAFDMTGLSARVEGTRADGTGFMSACTIGDGTVSFLITKEMTNSAGDQKAEIILFAPDNHRIGTANFIIRVEPAALDEDTEISPEDETLINQYITSLTEKIDEAMELVETAEQAAASAEASAGSAGRSADSAQHNALKAEQYASSAKASADRAESAAGNVSAQVQRAESAAAQAAVSASNAAASAAEAGTSANRARNSMVQAAGYQARADRSASDAQTYAAGANASRIAAESSRRQAAQSASSASSYANAAQSSAESALADASSANTYAQNAALSATAAEASADAAAASAEEAAETLAGKADTDGYYPDLYAGNLTTDKEQTDTAPYLFRPTASGLQRIDDRCYPALIGASVGENQLVQNGNFADDSNWRKLGSKTLTISNNECTFTVNSNFTGITTSVDFPYVSGHKYLISATIKASVSQTSVGFGLSDSLSKYQARRTVTAGTEYTTYTFIVTQTEMTINAGRYMIYGLAGTTEVTISTKNCMAVDLTQMLGSTIADRAYTLEQQTAGSGIAWLRSYGFITDDYMPYNSGTIESVEATAKVVRDENGENAITYPLGNDVLRGIFKLDSNNNIYADGDRKEADGTITRRYGVVDLGTLTWTWQSTWQSWYTDYILNMKGTSAGTEIPAFISDKYQPIATNYGLEPNNYIGITSTVRGASGCRILVKNGSSSDSPTGTLVYELQTPTTEQSTPFTSPQIVYPDGTERFVTENGVPVGHETSYPYDLKALVEGLIDVPDVPSANGAYVLRATRSASGVSYAWTSV